MGAIIWSLLMGTIKSIFSIFKRKSIEQQLKKEKQKTSGLRQKVSLNENIEGTEPEYQQRIDDLEKSKKNIKKWKEQVKRNI